MTESRRPPENVPDAPGAYLFKDRRGKILYVGKARSLKKRVASYFTKGPEATKTEALLGAWQDLETIVTNTELEALLLENALIKKHRPRYNVCLRDDKTYPYIKITTGEEWPRALVTRRVVEDSGAVRAVARRRPRTAQATKAGLVPQVTASSGPWVSMAARLPRQPA